MLKPCLIIVFNHRYDKNIPVLEQIYSGRFSHIFFLVPFYNGSKENVIPVYESSHYFQSFFAQGYNRFFKEEFSHYIFVGDDCILNPAINENNFLDITGLEAGAEFLPGIIELHKIKENGWWHSFKGIDFFGNRKGAEIKNELPGREAAVQQFNKHGVEVTALTMQNIFGSRTPANKKWFEYFLFKNFLFHFKWRKFKKNGKIELPYPVAGSYADVIVVTKQSIYNFCRYCGVMASAGLFVELAIPTALLLSAEKIMQEKDIKLKGKALWTAADITAVEDRYGKSLSALMKDFPADQLFFHPIKLSKWKNDL